MTQKLSDAERRKHMASYYAAISTLDAQVGAIVVALERLNLWENTIILFTSDHGRHLGEQGGIFDKRSLFERSVRVPLIVVAPGKRSKAVSPRLVEMVDFYPTLAQLCSLPAPAHLEGASFVPLLETPDRPWKKAAFSESGVSGTVGCSVRSERYRYTEWSETLGQLYDHQTDPHEQINLYADARHTEILAEMRKLLRAGWKGTRMPDRE